MSERWLMSYFAARKFWCIFRARGAVFKVRGPVTTSFEVGGGGGGTVLSFVAV